MSRNFISTSEELRKGDSLVSNNGDFKAVFQEDGNFVLYKWAPVWASNTTCAKPHRLVLQADTNLVIYDSNGTPVWSTGGQGNSVSSQHMRLTVTNDGKLQVENDGNVIWCNGKKSNVK